MRPCRAFYKSCSANKLAYQFRCGSNAIANVSELASQRQRPPSISVHKGYKIQAALCVERPPLVVVEPDFKKQWRTFLQAWELRTNNHLTIEDEITFMKFHFHFLGDSAACRALSGEAAPQIQDDGGGKKSKSDGMSKIMTPQGLAAGPLDNLLSDEGLNLSFPERNKRTVRRRKVQQRKVEQVDDGDVRSVRRLKESSLFLIVRYGGASSWTFPKTDRPHEQPMRDTLLDLCGQQLGTKFSPYIMGACPFAHRKRSSSIHPGIEGRSIFYYRGRLLPGMDITLPDDTSVTDWAWCSRSELPLRLSTGEWYATRDSLPLDQIA